MTEQDISELLADFEGATQRALSAGFQVIEIHMAHGYLLHQFLSPLSNQRQDEYGGTLENRMRLPLAVAGRVRSLWPSKWPVFVRVSATDWVDGGWNLEQTMVFARALTKLGIDLLDCSSGGMVPQAKIPTHPGYQVEFSEAVRKQTGMPTGAVGLITDPHQAEKIVKEEQADVVFIARELLRDPYWPLHAAMQLGTEIEWPKQYQRAKIRL
jgi:2,4-dienoyl-CoA reductase-like NADH-dependent reductase (Old Yellow Enzyme family)